VHLLFNPIEDKFDIVGLTQADGDSLYLRQDQNLADLDDAATARQNLGVEIGVDVQAWDATLQSISALGTAANRMIYTTGVDTWAEQVTTAYGRSLLTPANAIAARVLIDAQQADATLTALAGLTIAANSLTIGTGADAFTQTTFAANTFPARASTGDLVAKTITDFALTLLDDADAATARTTLGLSAGGAGDIWIEKAGDTFTGSLVGDSASNITMIQLVNFGTQSVPIFGHYNAGGVGASSYVSAINQNGRFISVASVSSGFSLTGSDVTSTTHLVLNHTSAVGSLINNTGSFSIEGFATSEIVINNTAQNVNFRVESVSNQNLFHVDADLNANNGGVGIGTNAQPDNLVYMTFSNAADINAYGLHVVATQTTSRSKTFRGLAVDVSHSGTTSQTGMNGLEFNLTTASNSGTVSTFQGVSANLTVGTASVVSDSYLFRAFNPTNNGGTLSNFTAMMVESISDNSAWYALRTNAGRVIFNDSGSDYSDFLIEGDTLSHMFATDATGTTENVALLASGMPNWQAMDRGLYVGNSSGTPTGNPSGGGFLYAVSGALTWRGSSGSVTTIAAA